MKIQFDSENFLQGTGRTFVFVLLYLLAAFLIFHVGVMFGRSDRHSGFVMHGHQGMRDDGIRMNELRNFTVSTYGDGTSGMVTARALPAQPIMNDGQRIIIYRQ